MEIVASGRKYLAVSFGIFLSQIWIVHESVRQNVVARVTLVGMLRLGVHLHSDIDLKVSRNLVHGRNLEFGRVLVA